MALNYTCLACRVMFDDPEVQRAHYKTDWHRYNLKRKVAELPPVSHGEFQLKVQHQAQKKEEKLKDKSESCKICNKSFSSVNAFDNHQKSKKHKEAAMKDKASGEVAVVETIEQAKKACESSVNEHILKADVILPDDDFCLDEDENSDEWEDVDEDEDEDKFDEEVDGESQALLQTFCLFCPHESVSLLDSFRHMTKSHSFFIPDLQFVTDLEALFIYLGAKVGDGKVCLYCNNHSKQFRTTRACQTHMVDKGHCLLDYDGDAMLEYADFYDFSSTYPENDGENDIDTELLSNENELSIDPSTMVLLLPSGARAGHRALRKYYNQSIPPEVLRVKNRAMISGVNSQYKALGLNERTLAVATRKKIEAKKTENYQRLNYAMKIGVKANKLQTHFRKQQMYCG